MSFFRKILLLTSFLSSLGSLHASNLKAKPKPKDLAPQINAWLKKFASTSALEARNKNFPSDLQISEEHLNQILQGKTKLVFPRTFHQGPKEITSVQIANSEEALKFEVPDFGTYQTLGGKALVGLESGERNRRILDAMENLVRYRPVNQLLILDVGFVRSLDLFFGSALKNPEDKLSKRRGEIYYFLPTLKKETEAMSTNYRKLYEMVRGIDLSVDRIKDQEVARYTPFLARLNYFQNLSSGGFTLAKLKTAVEGPVGVLVYMDPHEIQATDAFQELPSGESWKKLGFTTVVLASEQLQMGKTYDSKEYAQTYTASDETSPYLAKAESKVKKWVSERTVIVNPAQEALHRKLQDYEKQGMAVTYTGVSPVDVLGAAKEKPVELEQ